MNKENNNQISEQFNLINFESYEGDEPYIYVTYSPEDITIMSIVLNKLNESYYRICYKDIYDMENVVSEDTKQKIKNSQIILFIASEISTASNRCLNELLIATEYHKRILPLIIDEKTIKMISESMAPHIIHIPYINNHKYDKYLKRDLYPETRDRSKIKSNGIIHFNE